MDAFNKELLRRLRELPGAQSAGLTSFLPASNNNNNQTFVAEGYVAPKGEGMNLATVAQVVGDYLPAMGIPLLRGRFFTDADKAGAQLVVIVNRKLAQHYWPNQDPIGKRLRIGTQEMKTPWMTIVGEVADIKLSSPDEPTKEEYYLPVDQLEEVFGSLASPDDLNGNGGYIVLRSTFPPEQMENALRAAVRAIDPQLPLTQVQTMEQAVSETEAPRRFNTVLDQQLCLCCRVVGGARHLQRHRFLGRFTRAGDGHSHGSRFATVRNHAPDFDLGREACGRWMCTGIGGRDRQFGAAPILALWRKPV